MTRGASQPQYLFPAGARFASDNIVLHARGRRHHVAEFPGPLSIKSVIDGQVMWIVGGRSLLVDSSSFLILNEGERYSMDIDEPRPVETCCAFFQRGFVERIAQDVTGSVDASLDATAREAPPLRFLSRLHRDSPSEKILPQLRSMGNRCSGELQPSGFEEDFLVLAEKVLLLYEEISARLSRAPGTKASTREELCRRVERAKEYMHSFADEPVSLEDVSREACLSRYHLHRTFTRVFGQTPHAYLTDLRLERAQALLKVGRNVTETCMAVGFSSVSSFSALFRSRYGHPPSKVRARCASFDPGSMRRRAKG